jgi:hypothetical protein
MHWYNPATRGAESVPAPYTDEEATHMLSGATDSWAFVAEYERLREEGMGVEQAMIFVGHRFGMWHPRFHRGTNPWASVRSAQQQWRA